MNDDSIIPMPPALPEPPTEATAEAQPQAAEAEAQQPEVQAHAAETEAQQPEAQVHAAEAEAQQPEAQPQAAEAEAQQPEAQAQAPEAQAAPPAVSEGRRKAQLAWERLVNARASSETIQGTVKSVVKGGLLLDIDGYRGFLPASHVRVPKGTALESLVNTNVPVKVIDVDEQRKRVVVSHRRAMEEERRTARTQLLQSLKVGEERDATVVRLADFGAFVDLGGIDALIPLGELAFERVEKASDVVHPGEKLKVRVLRIDEGGKKIAVSRKGALADPWRDHSDILRQGNVVEGTVIAKEPRLTIEVAPGVSGTLGDREADPNEYEIGEKVEVTIRSVDFRNRRIRLSTPHAAQSYSSSGFAPLGTELGR